MLWRSSGAFWSFWVSGKYSGMRSRRGGTHRKDTGNIGNDRGSPYRSLTLFLHMECNIEVIPYYQECLSANKSNNLKKPLLAKIFNFVNCGCVRQHKSGMVQNVELCLRGTTCK